MKGAAADSPHARVVLLATGALLLVVAVVVTAVLLLPGRTVRMPDLVGIPRQQAADRLTALGLTLQVRDTRFSPTIAKDSIAAQEPTAGLLVAPGSTVIVDLSAGSESFPLPDVIGQDLDTARTALRARGLTVTFTTSVSDADSGTVIASSPAAGTAVSTGDTVRLTLATSVGAISGSDLTGVAIVLDPAPPNAGDASDVSMDVALRVRALLTAAGATVTMTRESGVTSPAATPANRTGVAKETSATALVGFSVAPSSLEGMVLLTMQPTSGSDQAGALAGPLADAVFASLKVDTSTISTLTASGDVVLSGSGLPGVRVRLGSFASESDAASFADERWLEVVANDTYRALAQLYGRQ
jgi:beta-lactam-binding protein with PASTA domain